MSENGLPFFDAVGEFHRQVNATRLNAVVGGLRGAKLQPSKGMRTTETTGGTTAVPILKRYPPRGPLPPFWPLFKPNSKVTMDADGNPATVNLEADWVCTVSKGIVIDNVPIDNAGLTIDAYETFELLELIDAEGQPAEFPINPGEAVYVVYSTDPTGAIKTDGSKPRLYIGADGEISHHYDPPVGDQYIGGSGVRDGTYNHKLAIFDVDSDGLPIPEYFEAGNNIQHWRELSQFKKAGGTADVFKDYDLIQGKYLTRGITGGTGITVTQRDDDILIEPGSGENLDLEVYVWTFAYDGLGALQVTEETTPVETHYWRNGIYVGNLWTDDPPLDPPANVRRVSCNTF